MFDGLGTKAHYQVAACCPPLTLFGTASVHVVARSVVLREFSLARLAVRKFELSQLSDNPRRYAAHVARLPLYTCIIL